MRLRFLGAASIAALLSLGMAACGQNDTYTEADADTETTRTAADDTDTTATDPYAANETDMTTDTTAADPYATPSTPTTTARTTTDYGTTSVSGDIIQIAEITDKPSAERVAAEAFDKADANGDGTLTRTEYMELALSAEQFAPSAIDETGEMSGEGDVDTGVDTTAPGSTTMPSTTTPTADATKVDAAFAEAAGDDDSLTKDELRAAFLSRFEVADADGNDELDDAERQTFATLTAGGQ